VSFPKNDTRIMDLDFGNANLTGNSSWNLRPKGGDLSIRTGMQFIFQRGLSQQDGRGE
jgi:hypothetical protein